VSGIGESSCSVRPLSEREVDNMEPETTERLRVSGPEALAP